MNLKRFQKYINISRTDKNDSVYKNGPTYLKLFKIHTYEFMSNVYEKCQTSSAKQASQPNKSTIKASMQHIQQAS